MSFLPSRIARLAIALAAFAGGAGGASAQGLAAYVAPARFELKGAAGETQRHVLDIQHVGRLSGRYRIYTNDWEFQKDNALKFSDALVPDSCRPWVALERRELTLAPNAKYRFRFEVTPPPGTPPRECRFAIMVEGADTTKVEQGGFSFPVGGRLGVIVYVAVGEVEPKLSIVQTSVRMRDGEQSPFLEMSNTGTAHGRLEGFLNGKDATGREFEIAPEDSPILPGMTRSIVLRPIPEGGGKPPAIHYPLTVKGTLEWGKKRESVDLRFAP